MVIGGDIKLTKQYYNCNCFSDARVIVNYLGLPPVLRRGNKLYIPLLVTQVQLSDKVGMRLHPPRITKTRIIKKHNKNWKTRFFISPEKTK